MARRSIHIDAPSTPPRPARAIAFVALGVLLYALLYAGAERLTRQMADLNPVHRIISADPDGQDWIILGASHAMPLGFQDFGTQITETTGLRILNLAVQGTGPLYHRFIAERFFNSHRTHGVLVLVDSFGFYDPKWNEDRFADTDLLARTPFDLLTLRLLASYLRHGVDPRALLDYAVGFSKINNRDRLSPDRWDAEDQFDRAPRPSSHADRERIAYLYPQPHDAAILARYLDHLTGLIWLAQTNGAQVIVIKPPVPARFAALLPHEAAFDAALSAHMEAHLAGTGVTFHDFTAALPEPEFYFDADHLNRRGATRFLQEHLAPLLAAQRQSDAARH